MAPIRKILTVTATVAVTAGLFNGLAQAQKAKREDAPAVSGVTGGVVHVEPTTLTDFGDDRRLVGWADNVFVGTVVARRGHYFEQTIPFSTFDVRVLRAVKGTLSGNVVVDQLGGLARDGQRIVIHGDTVLEPGRTYVFATRVNHGYGYHTMSPQAGATAVADGDLARLLTRFRAALRDQIPYRP